MVALAQLPVLVPLVVSFAIDLQYLEYSSFEVRLMLVNIHKYNINVPLSQVSANTLLQVTHCYSRYQKIWRSLGLGYLLLLLLALGLLSVHNSKITSRYGEEGDSGNRVVLLMVVLIFSFIIALAFLESNLVAYKWTVWLYACWFVVLPDLLLLTLFIPKVGLQGSPAY